VQIGTDREFFSSAALNMRGRCSQDSAAYGVGWGMVEHLIESDRTITELARRMEITQQAASKIRVSG